MRGEPTVATGSGAGTVFAPGAHLTRVSLSTLALNGLSSGPHPHPPPSPRVPWQCNNRQTASPVRLRLANSSFSAGSSTHCMAFTIAPTSTCLMDPLSKCCRMDVYKMEMLIKPSCSKTSVARATINGINVLYSVLYPAQVRGCTSGLIESERLAWQSYRAFCTQQLGLAR